MRPGFGFYQHIDYCIAAIILCLGFIGTIVIKWRRKEYPVLFMVVSVALAFMWIVMSHTDTTWLFWKDAYVANGDAGKGRIYFNTREISYVSERIFNNVLIVISSILLLSTILWDGFIRYIDGHKLSNKNVDNQNGLKTGDIGLFYFSCVGIFLLQIIISYFWPSSLFSSQNIGLVKNCLRIVISVAPIGLSFYFCNKFWHQLEEELNKNKFSDSIYPTLMVAQGTFYTFVGVSAILLTYVGGKNVDVILQGLKLAFLTSVVGLLYSIAARFKIKNAMDKHYNEVKDNEVKLATLKKLNSSESGITIPEYLDERDFYVVLKKIDNSLAKFANELVDANTACLRKQADVFEDRLDLAFAGLKKNMEEIAILSGDIKRNFEEQKVFSTNLHEEMKSLWENAHGAYKNIDATAKSFNDFLANCKVEQLAPTINQVTELAGVTEQLNNDADTMLKMINRNLENINKYSEKIVSWTSSIDANIDKVISTDEKLSAKIVEWSSDIKHNIDTVLVVDEQLSNAFVNYKDKLEQINLDKVADLLTELKSNYDKLAIMQAQDVNLYMVHKETIDEQISLLKAVVQAQRVALEEQQNVIKVQEAQAQKVMDEREKTITLIIDKREEALNETISNMKCIDVSMSYAGDAISNLQERLNFDADQVCDSIAEIGQGILGQNVAVAKETYKQLLAEQKKYLENLEDERNKTLRASLEVTHATLNKIIEEMKDDRKKL